MGATPEAISDGEALTVQTVDPEPASRAVT
jgi:hypothetical protein